MLRHPALAVVAMLVWMLGVEVGPGLHIARHGELAHHHHGSAEAEACSAHEHAAHGAEADHGAHHATEVHLEQRALDEHDEQTAHHEHPGHHEHGDHEHSDRHELAEPHDDVHHDTAVPHDTADSHEHGDRLASAHEHPSAAHEPGSVPHGAGSLAHRDLVPLTPPLVLPPILSAPWQPLAVASTPPVSPSERTPDVLRARGPPNGVPSPDLLAFA